MTATAAAAAARSAAVALVVAGMLAGARAQAARGPEWPTWTFALGVERGSNDNILQLTPDDIARFDRSPAPPRFLITSTADDITALHGDAYAHLRILRRRDTRLGASFDGTTYDRNEVKNWHQFGASLSQELTASRRHLTTLNAWRTTLPRYYLRQITDADASFAAGARIRRSLDYAQRTAGVRLAQEWWRGRVALGLGFERITRDYNAEFDERDNHNDQWRITAGGRPLPGWGLTTELAYVAGHLRAHGDLAASPIVDTDISYDHHGLGGSITAPWGHAGSRGHVEVDVMPEVRTYRTTDRFDVARFGRVNHRLDTTVRVVQRVWAPFELVGTWERLTSDASFNSGIDLPEDQTDFDQTERSIMLRARWEIGPRH